MKKHIIIIALFFGIIILLQMQFNKSKGISGGDNETLQINPITNLPPAEFMVGYIGSIFMGGLKSIAVDYLWLKYIKLEEDKQFEEALTVMKLIANLNPYLEDVWVHNAHNMIYNISILKDTPDEQWIWIDNGLDYAESGLRWNPKSWRIEEWMGFFYYHKIPFNVKGEHRARQFAKDKKDCYEMAAYWYAKAAEDVLQVWPDKAYGYDMDVFECMQKHVFNMIEGNLVYDEKTKKTYRFEAPPEAIMKASRDALDFGRTIVPKYKGKCSVGELFIKNCIGSFEALGNAFDLEYKAIEARRNNDREGYFRIMSQLPGEYANVIASYPGVYQSEINARIISIIKQIYMYPAFEGLDKDSSMYGKAIESVKNTQDFCSGIFIEKMGPTHVWREYAAQFGILNDILRAEAGAAVANNEPEALMRAKEIAEKALDSCPNTVITELFEARKRAIDAKLLK
ncbi:MAG: hypothetical protein HZA48_08250 [Planctomycetes bacterium]|nr:hypothetical protein [Planctomycetota bacterium]